MDCFSKQKRSDVMRCIKSKNTRPEMLIRKGLHKRGYRYRLHRKDLPGSPDLVFSACMSVIFIHGCFWHMHDCPYFKMPRTNRQYWDNKLKKNAMRDKRHTQCLIAKGWRVLVVWECALKRVSETQLEAVLDKCEHFLSRSHSPFEELAGQIETP